MSAVGHLILTIRPQSRFWGLLFAMVGWQKGDMNNDSKREKTRKRTTQIQYVAEYHVYVRKGVEG